MAAVAATAVALAVVVVVAVAVVLTLAVVVVAVDAPLDALAAPDDGLASQPLVARGAVVVDVRCFCLSGPVPRRC